jgi:hypothetical protein
VEVGSNATCMGVLALGLFRWRLEGDKHRLRRLWVGEGLEPRRIVEDLAVALERAYDTLLCRPLKRRRDVAAVGVAIPLAVARWKEGVLHVVHLMFVWQ